MLLVKACQDNEHSAQTLLKTRSRPLRGICLTNEWPQLEHSDRVCACSQYDRVLLSCLSLTHTSVRFSPREGLITHWRAEARQEEFNQIHDQLHGVSVCSLTLFLYICAEGESDRATTALSSPTSFCLCLKTTPCCTHRQVSPPNTHPQTLQSIRIRTLVLFITSYWI